MKVPLLTALCTAALLWASQASVHAQALADPTRPPALLAPAHADTSAALAASAAPQLQSVLIARGPNGRHIAVIDGQTVRLGEAFRGARVMRMTQTEVELVRGKERQVLKLYAPAAGPAVQR